MRTHRVVEAIVGDIALRRAVPGVFLLDETGTMLVGPAHTAIPAGIVALIDMYLSGDSTRRTPFAEIVDLEGTRTTIRIVPFRSSGPARYALILAPFVVRSRPHAEAAEASAP